MTTPRDDTREAELECVRVMRDLVRSDAVTQKGTPPWLHLTRSRALALLVYIDMLQARCTNAEHARATLEGENKRLRVTKEVALHALKASQPQSGQYVSVEAEAWQALAIAATMAVQEPQR